MKKKADVAQLGYKLASLVIGYEENLYMDKLKIRDEMYRIATKIVELQNQSVYKGKTT
jgi:hypothetical protein